MSIVKSQGILYNIKKYLDFAKTGEYISSLDGYEEQLLGIKLAFSNQQIIKVNK